MSKANRSRIAHKKAKHTLDTGDENFGSCGLLDESWSLSVNWGELGSLNWSTLVNWVTSDVHDTTEGTWTDGNHNWVSGVDNLTTTDETFSTC